MTTLTEFLLARIAEDEARVVLVKSAPPKWTMTVFPHDGERIPVEVPALTPARVLAECDAKRRIVTEVVPRIDRLQDAVDREWGANDDHETLGLLCALALPYVDHPDYQPEWKP